MKRNIFSTIVILTAAMLMWSFAGKDNGYLKTDGTIQKIAADSLLNNIWMLQTLNEKEVVKEKAGHEMPYLEFHLNDNSVTGNTGCNTFSGKALVTPDEITFSDVSVTKMSCTDAQYEQDILNIVFYKGALKYKMDNESLLIFRDDAVVMVLKKKD